MRRLPVLNNSSAPEDAAAAARPRWQWILIGAGFTFVFWVPVALLVGPLSVPLGMLSALPLIVLFALAAAGAGAVMGRFAPRSKSGDAAWAAVVCSAVLAALTAPSSVLLAVLAFGVLAPMGAVAAFLGARRMRPAVPSRST